MSNFNVNGDPMGYYNSAKLPDDVVFLFAKHAPDGSRVFFKDWNNPSHTPVPINIDELVRGEADCECFIDIEMMGGPVKSHMNIAIQCSDRFSTQGLILVLDYLTQWGLKEATVWYQQIDSENYFFQTVPLLFNEGWRKGMHEANEKPDSYEYDEDSDPKLMPPGAKPKNR